MKLYPRDVVIAKAIVLLLSVGLAWPLFCSRAKAQSVWDKLKQQAQKARQQQQSPSQHPKPAQQQPGEQAVPAGAAPGASGGINYAGDFTPPAGTKIEATLLAPFSEGSSFQVSPHGLHAATLAHSGSRVVIIYDGVPGPKFDALISGSAVQPVVFSPDGSRYAYCGQSGNEWVVMVDGKELARGPLSVGNIGPSNCVLGFTSNSKHVFFTSLQLVNANDTI